MLDASAVEEELVSYPNDTGIWKVEIDAEPYEIEVRERNGQLVVNCDELDDIPELQDVCEECEDNTQYVLASSLTVGDSLEVWTLID